jgi:hypothetical protein
MGKLLDSIKLLHEEEVLYGLTAANPAAFRAEPLVEFTSPG